MRRVFFFLSFLLFGSWASAGSSSSLPLSGTVVARLDYQVAYNAKAAKWVLSQTTNGNLKAILTEESSQYRVIIFAP